MPTIDYPDYVGIANYLCRNFRIICHYILITTDRRGQSLYHVGVHRCQWGNCVRYQAHFHHNKSTVHVGYFKTPEEAFYAYKSGKEQKVKEIATQYFQEGKITHRVYQALMEYQVEITD